MAEEVRARLEDEQPITAKKLVKQKPHYLDELQFRKPVRRHVAEFGAIFAVIFLIIGGVIAYRGGPLFSSAVWTAAALIFAGLGYRAPAVLHPLWKGWMKFAHVLGMVMTTVILALAWTIALLPTAFGMRLFGAKVMDTTFDRAAVSYWEDRTAKQNDFKLLERQF